MKEKRDNYRPCSDLDIRAAALRSTHERLREMDSENIPTVGKFGDVLREEKAKFRTFGEYKAEKDTCSIMTWDDLKKSANAFADKQKK